MLAHQRTTRGRTDAQVYFVFDISRSMAAKAGPKAPTRLDRARTAAKRIRAKVGNVPAGVVSLTDRVLPHLFPSLSANAFNAVADRALGIDRPAAQLPWGDYPGTVLASVGNLASGLYFSPKARRRAVVVLTDGETLQEQIPSLPARLRSENIKPFLLRFWAADERVYQPNGVINPAYSPDPASGPAFDTIANSLQTRVYSEQEIGKLGNALRVSMGTGPTGTGGRELASLRLAPYLVALALLPLGFLLYRRNLPPALVKS